MHHRSWIRSALLGCLCAAALAVGCSSERPDGVGVAGSVPREDGIDAIEQPLDLRTLAGWTAVVQVAIDATGVDSYSAGGPLSGSQELCEATVLGAVTGDLAPGTVLTLTCAARGRAGGLDDAQAAAAYGLPPQAPTPGSQVAYALTPLPGPTERWATRIVRIGPDPASTDPGGSGEPVPAISTADGSRIETMSLTDFQELAASLGG